MSRILLVVNDAWFLVSHRLAVVERALAAGHEVHVAARADASVARIRETGCRFHPWTLDPRGRAIRHELRAVASLASILRRVRPDMVHLVTIKAILYGGLLARLLGIGGVLYAVSGLGAVHVTRGMRATLLRAALRLPYRLALGHANAVAIFQNADDRAALERWLRPPALASVLIPGSGVRLDRYRTDPPPGGRPRVLMAARLLRDKGVYEFEAAAHELAARGHDVNCQLAGDLAAAGNPAALDPEERDALAMRGNLELLGHRDDIATLLADCSIAVLPSWREGMPKFLLEAAASARPSITTDVPGCRDAIEPNRTGLLVPLHAPMALADAIEALVTDPVRARNMGVAARALAERRFDIDTVTRTHLALYERLIAASPRTRSSRRGVPK